MEKSVSVSDVSANQKKIRVEIPASSIKEEIDKKYRELAKTAKIKGFRPGKIPVGIIRSYYGKSVEHEVSSEVIQKTFPEALKETELKPLAQADVSESGFEENGSFAYTAVVDVCPPFDLPGYKGIEVTEVPEAVSEEEIAGELNRIREQHTELKTVEPARPVKEGDMVLIDFTPSVDGKVFEKGKTRDHLAEVGKKSIHPDLDAHLIGRNAGEAVTFELDYPEDAPTREIAGKRVRFDLTIREVKEKEVPELNDEFAQMVGQAGQFETLDELKSYLGENIKKRQEQLAAEKVRQQIVDKLLELVQFELPSKAVEQEIDRMIRAMRFQFENQGLRFDEARFSTPEMREGYRQQAERNVRRHLIFEKIAEAEGIVVSEADRDEIYKNVARLYRIDPGEAARDYAESPLVREAEESKIQEKVFELLEKEAAYSTPPKTEAVKPGKKGRTKSPEQE